MQILFLTISCKIKIKKTFLYRIFVKYLKNLLFIITRKNYSIFGFLYFIKNLLVKKYVFEIKKLNTVFLFL